MSFAVMTNNVQFNADNTPTLTIGIQQQPIDNALVLLAATQFSTIIGH